MILLPGRSPSGNDFVDTYVLDAITEELSVDSIAITNQEARGSVVRKRLDNLLCRPLSGWMFGHVEMNNHPAVMAQHNESKQ